MKGVNPKKCFLFDYDGVLADTMGDMYASWSFALNVYKKVKLSKTFFFLLEGLPAERMSEELVKKYKINKNKIKDMINHKNDYYFKYNQFRLNYQAIKLVDFLKVHGIQVGIVTGAPRARITKMISPSIFSKFDVVVTSDDVKNCKPDPEPYLKAIEKLKVKKKYTTVIENAPLGIESAKSAGVHCIAIESTLEKKYLLKADKIFKNFGDVLIYFSRML